MAKQLSYHCLHPKQPGYADGGLVKGVGPRYSDSKTMQENLSYPSTAAARTSKSQPNAAEASGGYAEVPGTHDTGMYPADSDAAQDRVRNKRSKM